MKRRLFVSASIAMLTMTGVVALNVASNSGLVSLFGTRGSDSYSIILNNQNQPTDSDSYVNTISEAIEYNEHSQFNYQTVKFYNGGHCTIGNNGYIEKAEAGYNLNRVTVSKSGSGSLSIKTGFEQGVYNTSYDVTESVQTIDICGNYIKVVSSGETNLINLEIFYECGADTHEEHHNFGSLHPAKAATYKEDGNVAYYECQDCHVYFNSTKTEQLFDIVIPREVTYQTLVLKDATITSSAGSSLVSESGTTRTYSVIAGNQVTIQADAEANGKMFVGFDQDEQNNRIGNPGEKTYTFEMPLDDMNIDAIYGDIDEQVLSVPYIKTFTYEEKESGVKKKYNYATTARFDLTSDVSTVSGIKSATAIAYGNSEEGLEGMSGYSITYPGNATKYTGFTRNIIGSHFESTNKSADMNPAHWTYKAIFKNHSSRSVTVELYSEYYNNVSTSGKVTVPANSVVTKYFTQRPFTPSDGIYVKQGGSEPTSGLSQVGFALRNNLSGSASEDVVVDFVLGRAYTYKDNSVMRPSTTDSKYLTFVSGTNNPDGASFSHANPSHVSRDRCFTHIGSLFLCGQHLNGSTNKDLYPDSYGDDNPTFFAPGIANAPAKGKTFDIYVRVTNLMSSFSGYSTCVPVYATIDIIWNTSTSNPSNFLTASSAVVGDLQEFAMDSFGCVKLLKVTVTRPNNAEKMWFMLRGLTAHANIASKTVKYNFSVQASYENLFGYKKIN